MKIGNSDNKQIKIEINIHNAVYEENIGNLSSIFNNNLDTNHDGKITDDDKLTGKYKKIAENLTEAFRNMVKYYSECRFDRTYDPTDPVLRRISEGNYEFTLAGISSFFADVTYATFRYTGHNSQFENDFIEDTKTFFSNVSLENDENESR